MNNTRNLSSPFSDESLDPLTACQLTLVLTSLFVSTLGLSGYAAYVYVVRKHKASFSNPFYTFARSLAVPDFVVGLILIAYSYPVTLMRFDPYPPRLTWLCGLIMNISWFALISHVAVIATNRMLAVLFYTRVNTLFSTTMVRSILASCYIFAITMTVLEYGCACGQFFVDDTWIMKCDETKSNYCGEWPLEIDMYISNGMAVYVLLLNVVIVVLARRAARRIRLSDKGTDNALSIRRAAGERSMIIQCAFVSLILAMYQASFWIMGFLTKANIVDVTNGAVIGNLLGAVNSAMHPLIYFMCSSEIRREMRKMRATKIGIKLLAIGQAGARIAYPCPVDLAL